MQQHNAGSLIRVIIAAFVWMPTFSGNMVQNSGIILLSLIALILAENVHAPKHTEKG